MVTGNGFGASKTIRPLCFDRVIYLIFRKALASYRTYPRADVEGPEKFRNVDGLFSSQHNRVVSQYNR
jgi:hypothetical protein